VGPRCAGGAAVPDGLLVAEAAALARLADCVAAWRDKEPPLSVFHPALAAHNQQPCAVGGVIFARVHNTTVKLGNANYGGGEQQWRGFHGPAA